MCKLKKNKNVDILFKSSDANVNSNSSPNSNLFEASKRQLNFICKNLTRKHEQYQPEKTIDAIKKYMSSSDNVGRILYSEISNYIFSLDSVENQGSFITNVESMLNFALDDANGVDIEVKKVAVKIYDHTQLALHQINNSQNIIANQISSAKMDITKVVKGIEKEYIAILGIFASIVLTFVGGIAFSSSVLNNIGNVGIYRLLITSIVIGAVVINILFGLFFYLEKLVHNKGSCKPLVIANIIIIALAVAVGICWYKGVVEHRNLRYEDTSSEIVETSEITTTIATTEAEFPSETVQTEQHTTVQNNAS